MNFYTSIMEVSLRLVLTRCVEPHFFLTVPSFKHFKAIGINSYRIYVTKYMPVSGTIYYFLIYINKDLTTFNELKTTNSAQHGTIFGLFGDSLVVGIIR